MRQTQTDTWDMRQTQIHAAKVVSGITDSLDRHKDVRQTQTHETDTKRSMEYETDTDTFGKSRQQSSTESKYTLSKVVTES